MNPDAIGVRDGKMQLFSGKYMNPLKPQACEIDILDIAHALSNLCRFGGHVRSFYSVAQHSVLVSYNVDNGYALTGLLHDAGEAYLSDLIRPIKSQPGIGEAYKIAEVRLEKVIAKKFGISFPFHASVKRADNVVLFTEQRDLKPAGRVWPGSEGFKMLRKVIKPWEPAKAERKFLERFYSLSEAL